MPTVSQARATLSERVVVRYTRADRRLLARVARRCRARSLSSWIRALALAEAARVEAAPERLANITSAVARQAADTAVGGRHAG